MANVRTGSGNDIISASTPGNTYLGEGGNDVYIIDPTFVGAGAQINISDNQGTNTIRLVGGLSITGSQVTATALQLTLSNGTKIFVDGSSTFGYQVGGVTNGTGAVAQTWTELVTTTLGLPSVPPAGGAPVTGGAVTVGVAPPNVFTLTAAATTVNEGASLLFTVKLGAVATAATTVTFALKPGVSSGDGDQGTDKTNLNDFLSGSFTPVTVTIPIGSDTATFSPSPWMDGITELTESFSVDATVAGVTKNLVASVLDGAGGVGGVGKTFDLTPGLDFADTAGSYRNGSGNPFDFKFTTSNETVNATNVTMQVAVVGPPAVPTDSLLDGTTTDNDVLNLVLGAGAAHGPATISNIETINVTVSNATAAGALDFSAMTGAKTLNITGASAVALSSGAGALSTIELTGITTVDATGMTSAVNGLTVDFTGSTSTAALTFKGGAAGDNFVGVAGADVVQGNGGDDALNGGAGADNLSGGDGVDVILGGTNNDTINGDAGVDTLDGQAGNDTVNGGAGNDIIGNVGGGQDVITGGAGNDVITLVVGAGNSETLKFEATAAANGTDATAAATFSVGTIVAGGDVLDFSAFLGSAASFAGKVPTATVNPAAAGYSAAVGENVVVLAVDVLLDPNLDGLLSLAEFQGSTLALGNNVKAVVLYENAANTVIYYVTTDVNGAYAAADLVGTLTGSVALAYTAAQFA